MLDLTNDESGWILTIASSLTCVLGCSVIFVDSVWNTCATTCGFPGLCFELRDNVKILGSSLSLSAGVLIFNSMYRLLPSAMVYFDDSIESAKLKQGLLMATYIFGILICSIFNGIIHALTANSVVHHSYGAQSTADESDEEQTLGEGNDTPQHQDSENTPLLQEATGTAQKVKETLIDFSVRKLRGKRSIGKCLGFADVCSQESDNATSDARAHSEHSPAHDEDDHSRQVHQHFDDHVNQNHHHHVSTKHSYLLSIGLQTSLALTLHKLPEGFLTFATTHADRQLGFNVFLSLAIHNFAEGFSMALPLYLALGSRWKAFLSSVALGGLSQPIGAALAYFLYKQDNADVNSKTALGLLICFTAGFLSIIGFQMYGTALTYCKSQRTVLICVFVGIFLIGFSYCLTA